MYNCTQIILKQRAYAKQPHHYTLTALGQKRQALGGPGRASSKR